MSGQHTQDPSAIEPHTFSIRPIKLALVRYYWQVQHAKKMTDVQVSSEEIVSSYAIPFTCGWSFTRWGARRSILKAVKKEQELEQSSLV